MIINMSGGGAKPQAITYTNTDNFATSLQIPVNISGGVIKSFALMLLDQEITGTPTGLVYSVYASETDVLSKAYTYSYYDSVTHVTKGNVLGLGYTYDISTGILTINGYGSMRFLAGEYALMIW